MTEVGVVVWVGCVQVKGDVTLVLRLERLYEFLSFWWGVSTWMRWEWWFGWGVCRRKRGCEFGLEWKDCMNA